jgi:hypothetical protein
VVEAAEHPRFRAADEEVSVIYLDTSYAFVQWDDANRFVLLEWRDFTYGEEYRLALEKVLEALDKHHSNKLLADARKMRAIPQEDQDWLMKNWVPRSVKIGLKHSAIVIPKTTHGQLSLQQLAKAASGSKRLVSTDGSSYFETIEEAKKWLRSLPENAAPRSRS